MPTELAVEFPWGRYHATPWRRNVNEAVVEWPPSPWRVLRALYATWRWRAPELDEAVVIRLLNALAEAPSYFVPPYVEAHTRHYMPDTTHMKGRPKWQATTAFSDDAVDKVLDAYTVFDRGGTLLVRWSADLGPEELAALRRLAASLSYLGRADSICAASVAAGPHGEHPASEGVWLSPLGPQAPASTGLPSLRLLVPKRPLDLTTLTVTVAAMREMRTTVPPGTEWVPYGQPRPADPRPQAVRRAPKSPTAVRWAISTPARPSLRAALAMTDVFRQACMGQFGRVNGSAVSAILAGKDSNEVPLKGHGHAHYLAADLDGDKLLDHLILWVPDGLGQKELQAIARLTDLRRREYISDFRPCRLGLEALGEVETVAPELVGPSRAWQSHTPFAPPRHPRRRQAWEEHVRQQVTEEISRRSDLRQRRGQAGIPRPVEVTLVPHAWLAFRRHRITESLEHARPAAGVRVVFEEPVKGPLVLGALCHFGLGLLLPDHE